jgi:hypothetical protein
MVVRRVDRDVPIAACKASGAALCVRCPGGTAQIPVRPRFAWSGGMAARLTGRPVGVGSGWSVRPFSLDHQGTSQLLYRATANPSGFASRLRSMTKMRSTPARVPRCADAYDLMIVTEAYEASGLGGPGTSTELLREVKSRHLLH